MSQSSWPLLAVDEATVVRSAGGVVRLADLSATIEESWQMYTELGDALLKNGASMEIGVVRGQDSEHADEIQSFLVHKGHPWGWHIEGALAGPLDDLETRFYVGKVDDLIITNIMTLEHVGVGIVGHVYTVPERRRLGACNAVMEVQMDEFRRRGGRCLHLGTGFDSPPYHIYKRHGFGSVSPRDGFMRYVVDDGVLTEYFARRPVTAFPPRWDDWAPLTMLTGSHDGDWLRSVSWSIQGPANFEEGFLWFLRRVQEHDGIESRVLRTEDGARVGWATLDRHRMWRELRVLDVLCHPNFWEDAATLVDGLPCDGKVVAYADVDSAAKLGALRGLGFTEEATLPARVRRVLRPDWRSSSPDGDMFDDSAFEDAPLDIVVLAR